MQYLTSPAGISVSYDTCGSGPALVLVHGSFSDHRTNWELAKPLLERQFTIYTIARRGRGDTDATCGHSLVEESGDVVTLLRAIGTPVFLLGHSYGAHLALLAAAAVPELVRKLVLYEPPQTNTLRPETLARLETLAQEGEWDRVATTFFHETLAIPMEELDELRSSTLWPPIVADAEASLGDLRAVSQHRFDAAYFQTLSVPVLLQIGTESPRQLYVTDALTAVLPDVRVQPLPGQAHEGMTTAPDLFTAAVSQFLLA